MDRNKKVKIRRKDKNEDRISRLPDEVIHQILSFSDARLAVQTSVLSKRWKLIWTTLPFLTFGRYSQTVPSNSTAELEFIKHVLLRRNHQFQIQKLKVSVVHWQSRGVIEDLRDYAISCNVQSLQIHYLYCYKDPHILSSYCSESLKQLKLSMNLKFVNPCRPDIWYLPSLTTLDLTCATYMENCNLPISYLNFLSSLQTLRLDYFQLPESFSLLSLTTLCLARCNLPQGPCTLPALLTLELDDVVYPANMTEFFSALVSLQNLTLFFRQMPIKDCLLNCPQLLNLKVTNATTRSCGNIMVLSPKICNFSSVGIFSITFGGSQLENVYVKLRDRTRCRTMAPSTKLKQYYRRFILMFPGFGSTKTLSLDLETIKALSAICDILAQFRSPFYNLKFVKLPQGYKESSICDSIRSYLLDGSPKATILTTPQVAKMYPNAPAEGAGDDRVRSSTGDGDIGLWQGHKVNSEFIGLLDLIMKKYPDTFEHFTTNTESQMFCTMKLNMLCTSVNDLSKTSTTEVDDKMVAKYKVLFADLQKLGFNVNWLVSHLQKIIVRRTASGTVVADLVGNIGDDLFL